MANKVRDEDERALVERFAEAHGLEVMGVVPHDERLPEAERAGRAPLDHAPDAAAIAAIADLARTLVPDGRA